MRDNEDFLYRSGLEADIAKTLDKSSVVHLYEGRKFFFEGKDSKIHRYTPDFVFPHSNIVIEAKGYLSRENRKRYLSIKKQFPEIDLRFIFADVHMKVKPPNGKVTYGGWCKKKGFKYAEGNIPEEWIEEIRDAQGSVISLSKSA